MTRFSFRAFRFATRCPGGRGSLHQLPSTAKPAAAKREAPQCDDHPDDLRTIRHGTAVTNLQKGKACPKAGQNRRLHRSADPRRAEGHCTGARQALFSLGRARPVSLLARQKRNGGCIPAGQAPCGSRNPSWPPDGGPNLPRKRFCAAEKVSPAGRCAPADNLWSRQSNPPA